MRPSKEKLESLRPTAQRLKQIRYIQSINGYDTTAVGDLLAEIDALEAENRKLKPIWDPGIDLMRSDLKKVEKERDRLKERVAKLREALACPYSESQELALAADDEMEGK